MSKVIVRVKVGMAGVHYDFSSEKVNNDWLVRHSILTNARVCIWSRDGVCNFRTEEFPPFSSEEDIRARLIGRIAVSVHWDATEPAIRVMLDDSSVLELRPAPEDKRQYLGIYYYPEGRGDWRLTEGFVVTLGKVSRAG